MESTSIPILEYWSDEGEIENVPEEVVDIPDCEGVSWGLWCTRIVTLHSVGGLPVAEGICHSVNSDLVLGCDGPLGDSLVAVQISKSLDSTQVPED
jgi:hypothetical protein